ncbi:MAG: hypothetical protein Q8R30_04300 [bacterium]|nr:hypothetical protein [bacterium]
MKKIKSIYCLSFFIFGISACSFFVITGTHARTTTPLILGSSTPRTLPSAASSTPRTPEVRATINFSGAIETVNLGTKTLGVKIHGVYGGTSGTVRLGFTFAPETLLSLAVPQGIALTRLGTPIALVSLKPGDTFNARAIIDRETNMGIVQSMHVSNPGAPLPFIIGTIGSINPVALTVKTSSATEQQFTLTPRTRIFTRGKSGALDDLAEGGNIAVAFTLNGNAMEAIVIQISPSVFTADLAAASFLLHTLMARGERAVHILDASLYRLNSIILKQENLTANLEQSGKDAADIRRLLSLAKTDLTSAQSLLTNASKAFNTLLRSVDAKKDAHGARDLLNKSITAEKKVFADIIEVQQGLRALSQ